MQLSAAPSKIVLAFAADGGKNTIPVASQIGVTPGAASYTDGFPPVTREPIAAGGTPPYGVDMNGILFAATALSLWQSAGANFIWDSTFASAISPAGYPKGATVLHSDGTGFWFNVTDNNTADPEGSGAVAAGWLPGFTTGKASVTMTNANVTLTQLQYGKPLIVITGLLTTNLQLIFPDSVPLSWAIVNETTGAFAITCKTVSGTGVVVTGTQLIVSDGTNITVAVANAHRILLTGDTTFYVNASSGNDTTGNGTMGTPWQTLNHAVVYIAQNIDISGFEVSVQFAAGTDTTGINISGSFTGEGQNGFVQIIGDNATPDNCIISTSGSCIMVGRARLYIKGFKLLSSGGDGIEALQGGQIITNGNMDFGACNQYHVLAEDTASFIWLSSAYTVSGGAICHGYANVGAQIIFNGAIALTGTPAFSSAFAQASNCGVVEATGFSFSGSATGVRYGVSVNGVINTNGGGATFFPGNSSGASSSGGQYV